MTKYLATFGKPRYIGAFDTDFLLKKAEQAVVSSARGMELSLIIGESDSEKVEGCKKRVLGAPTDPQAKGGEPPFQEIEFIRAANEEDLNTRRGQEEEEEKILVAARQMLREHKLPIKLVDAEYLLDGKKLFFYFTAEQRIDFRAYVRDLARVFKTRIEMRQIGVRDEAKVVKGLSPCGMPCCCSYWLERFEPICIKMVKEQNLALNPSKISGICGRLMCCMAYEHEIYRELWKDLPNPGTKIKTPGTSYIVSGVDIPSNSVRIFHPEKGEFLVKIEDFENFRTCVEEGKSWENEQPENFVEDIQIKPETPEKKKTKLEILTKAYSEDVIEESESKGGNAHSEQKESGKRKTGKKRRRSSRKSNNKTDRNKPSSAESSKESEEKQKTDKKEKRKIKSGKWKKKRINPDRKNSKADEKNKGNA